ncbi:MAG: hypothetical protein IPJ65_42140 [Archangiaceae bacterium]|nr:hypothetical protein [Archangiaceae bacterium]
MKLRIALGLFSLAAAGCGSALKNYRAVDRECYTTSSCLHGHPVCEWNDDRKCQVCTCVDNLAGSDPGRSRPR